MQKHIHVKSSIAKFDMLPWRVSMVDQLGSPFIAHITLLSERDDWDFSEVLGKDLSLIFALPDGDERYVNGFITEFSQSGWHGRYTVYEATLRPWLWFLSQTNNCRIFQNKSAAAIISKIFSERGFDFKEQYTQEYPERVYCVQYRESDLNFVSRLMEEEGIYYYIEHSDATHTLVLCDDITNHPPLKAYADIPFYHQKANAPVDTDCISHWRPTQTIKAGAYVLRDFDFTKPKTDLTATSEHPRPFQHSEYEMYDYPGRYVTNDGGDRFAKLRLEQQQTSCHRVRAQGNLSGLEVGSVFNLQKHTRDDQNGEYLVVQQQLTASVGGYETGAGEDLELEVDFEVMPTSETYRLLGIADKPRVEGPQTAIVVGTEGEEIEVDEYGRVKVQFHWDREGQMDEKSSCWIRVSQNWAGKRWGAMFPPRIGQEVIVEFLEGDPDRPIITGRVYNGEAMPPYDLPAEKTKSTIKSRSSKGGGGFNEFRFEDKKGEEQLFFHAEKNQDIRVKNDVFEWVGRDTHLTVKQDQIEQIDNDRQETIGRDHIEEIGRDHNLTIKGKEALSVDGSHSFTVKGDVIEVFKANHSEETTGDVYVKASNIVIEAMTNVTIKVGQSYIAIEAGGITIGTTGTIELDATGQVSVKGLAGLTLESPATAELKSASTTVKGDGMVTVQGGVVKIN